MHNLEQHMRDMKPNGLSAKERDRVWNAIAAATEKKQPAQGTIAVLPGRLLRRAVTLLVVFGLLLGGAATASAHNAMPGDWLFPVKIATEKAQILLARDIQKKETLRIKFAETRLAEVRTLLDAAIADPAVSSAIASSTSQTGQSATTATTTATSTPASGTGGTSTSTAETITLYLPAQAIKKIERTERAIEIALRELEATRAKLAQDGSATGVLVLDDIIAELKGVGNGSVTITHIAASGNNKKDGTAKVAIKATFSGNGTTTTATTSAFVGTITVNEHKNGAKITMRSSDVKTEITVRANSAKSTSTVMTHTSDKHDDDGDDRDDDKDKKSKHGKDKSKETKKSEKKTNICHKDGNHQHTIQVAVSAVRAHIAHGDVLGKCAREDEDGDNDDGSSDAISPTIAALAANPGTTTVIITFTTNEPARTELFIGTAHPPVTTMPNAARGTFALTHSYALAGLSSGTTYHYLVAVTDRAGNRATSSVGTFTTGTSGTSTPPPPNADTTAPEISAISAEAGTTSVTITWTTSESAKSRIWLATTSPVWTDVAPEREESGFATGHSMTFSGLSEGTTYRFVISAADQSGNRATTSERSFTTIALPPPDTTAPSFTSISGTASGTTATIAWATNEPARASLYWGASDPFDIGTASTVSFTSLVTSRDALLSGLQASTTYRYLIVARDAAGNTATSTEHSFITE